MEEWKDIPGYERIYQVSNFGKIKKLKTNMPMPNGGHRIDKEKILIQSICKKGYFNIGLSKCNKKKSFKVHRLVAIVFVKNPNNKPQVNHINCIKTDNNFINLEWVTNKENCTHAAFNGLFKSNPKSISILVNYSKNAIGSKNHKSVSIKNVKTGEIYQSLTECTKKNKITRKVLYRLIRTGQYVRIGN